MTDKWGPTYWNYLHFVSIHYPNNPTQSDKELHFNLIDYFIKTLPCTKCQNDIKKLINPHELKKHLENKQSLKIYIFNLHNKVNKKLKKKTISFSSFESLYKFNYFSNIFKSIKYHRIKDLLLITLSLVIIFFVYKTYFSK
tara:strand:- start:1092 stop:1514 length:423 start_codon:yes stop_codon:yes gene_type:complete